MSSTTVELIQKALALPERERAQLARNLLESLEPEGPDLDWESAWAAELDARLLAVERGEFKARDWREAIAEMRESLDKESDSETSPA